MQKDENVVNLMECNNLEVLQVNEKIQFSSDSRLFKLKAFEKPWSNAVVDQTFGWEGSI